MVKANSLVRICCDFINKSVLSEKAESKKRDHYDRKDQERRRDQPSRAESRAYREDRERRETDRRENDRRDVSDPRSRNKTSHATHTSHASHMQNLHQPSLTGQPGAYQNRPITTNQMLTAAANNALAGFDSRSKPNDLNFDMQSTSSGHEVETLDLITG